MDLAPRSHRWASSDTPALLALVAVAALLRLPTLGAKSLWQDEAFTVQALDESFGGMLSAVGETEGTPPLYYVLAWLWTRVFGLGEVGVRSLSAVLGIALVPVAYLAARELLPRRLRYSPRRS